MQILKQITYQSTITIYYIISLSTSKFYSVMPSSFSIFMVSSTDCILLCLMRRWLIRIRKLLVRFLRSGLDSCFLRSYSLMENCFLGSRTIALKPNFGPILMTSDFSLQNNKRYERLIYRSYILGMQGPTVNFLPGSKSTNSYSEVSSSRT